MEAYKKEFIEFMVESDVLKFGDFTLKSGRKSPFFMNAGAYVTGMILMYYSDRHIRVFRWESLLRSHTVNFTEKKSVTVQTGKRKKIMERIREVSLAVN